MRQILACSAVLGGLEVVVCRLIGSDKSSILLDLSWFFAIIEQIKRHKK
jgi:hypothetical protein